MKYIFLGLIFCFHFFSYSQNEDTKQTDEIAFAVLENVPVYKGCKPKWNNQKLKKCMSDKIINHVLKNFNQKVVNNLDLPDGKVRINTTFKINKEGDVVEILSTAPHKALEEESIRVINLIPKMNKPGYQKGKPVIVEYSLPIIFKVNSQKSSKKERSRK